MRPRIKKSTQKLEFCYSSVALDVKNSNIQNLKAELSLLNAKLAQLEPKTPKTPKAVEFKLFGTVVRKPLEIIPHLEAVGITFTIIYK